MDEIEKNANMPDSVELKESMFHSWFSNINFFLVEIVSNLDVSLNWLSIE